MIYFMIPMKTAFKAKILQQTLNAQRESYNNRGFSLIELLVTIVIIGILAAIALPTFLRQVDRASQSEAQNYIGSILRAQQSHRIANTRFANNINDLEEVMIPTQTENYQYGITGDDEQGTATAQPLDSKFRGYEGATRLVNPSGAPNGQVLRTVICESDGTGIVPEANIQDNGTGNCNNGSPINLN
ncbi:type IV pilin-like G/H family protein [Geitlerinema sp. PCC 9228]|uniref:type IV pilin protein n=1 Tax=Geitlerinema sp. PCC 9228 TaxID=111611 RepID=UPI00147AEA33|nr:type IV pilin-like G/H family protein [Geitlerinema sp. PCC 9228]